MGSISGHSSGSTKVADRTSTRRIASKRKATTNIESAEVLSSEDDEAEAEEGTSLRTIKMGTGGSGRIRSCLQGGAASLKIHRLVGMVEGMPDMVYVKLVGKSYRELEPISKEVLKREEPFRLQTFQQQQKKNGGKPNSHKLWSEADRIVNKRPLQLSRAGKEAAPAVASQFFEYLVVWKGLGPCEATWFDERSMTDVDKVAVARYELVALRNTHCPADEASGSTNPFDNPLTYHMPLFNNGRQLKLYQDESVRWMAGHFNKRRGCILGDEMGLGKTAQSIALLASIQFVGKVPGPFLVVAPTSVLGHWQKELRTWTNLIAVMYAGNAAERRAIFQQEMFFPKGSAVRYKFDVLLISYDRLILEKAMFRAIQWTAVIYDEAHKLKGLHTALRKVVKSLKTSWTLMLTGTPIQMNMTELFSMMNILDPAGFPSLQEFLQLYGGEGNEMPTLEQVAAVKACLDPILMRRLKEFVETIPPMEETLVMVGLMPMQCKVYRALYDGSLRTLLGRDSSKRKSELRNLGMQLRKVCCHPFLIDGVEDEVWIQNQQDITERKQGLSDLEMLVRASGKLVMVHKLLLQRRTEGRRVVIISQYTSMLDLLENMLGMMDLPFERIDGSVDGCDRQAYIDHFNEGPDEDCFVMLLSTRAGGMGINLTAADTCVIYDSDWNPQGDIQAKARLHRIGQLKEVKVFRLMTEDTYEQTVYTAAAKRHGLAVAVAGASGSADHNINSNNIKELLKHGAHNLAAMVSIKDGSKYGSESIEQVLQGRIQQEQELVDQGNAFSVAHFVTEQEMQGSAHAPVHKEGKARADCTDKGFWRELLPEAVAVLDHQEQAADAFADGQNAPVLLVRTDRKGRDNSNMTSQAAAQLQLAKKKARLKKASDGHGTVEGLSGVASTSTAAANLSRAERDWNQEEVKKVLGRLLALGAGRCSWMMGQLMGKVTNLADPLSPNMVPFRHSLDRVSYLCNTLASFISVAAAAEVRLPKNSKGRVSALVAALVQKYLTKNGTDKAEAEPVADVCVGARAEPESAEGDLAKEAVGLELSTEDVETVQQLFAVLMEGPKEAMVALCGSTALNLLLTNAAKYKNSLKTNQCLAQKLLPLLDRIDASRVVHTTAVSSSSSSGTIQGPLVEAHIFHRGRQQFSRWWSSTDDWMLLRAVIKCGFVSWGATEWVRETLNDSESGFPARVMTFERWQAENKQDCDAAAASGAVADHDVDPAAVNASTVQGEPAASAENDDWFMDPKKRIVYRHQWAWLKFEGEVINRVKILISIVTNNQDLIFLARPVHAPNLTATLLAGPPPKRSMKSASSSMSVPLAGHTAVPLGQQDSDPIDVSSDEDDDDDIPLILSMNLPQPPSNSQGLNPVPPNPPMPDGSVEQALSLLRVSCPPLLPSNCRLAVGSSHLRSLGPATVPANNIPHQQACTQTAEALQGSTAMYSTLILASHLAAAASSAVPGSTTGLTAGPSAVFPTSSSTAESTVVEAEGSILGSQSCLPDNMGGVQHHTTSSNNVPIATVSTPAISFAAAANDVSAVAVTAVVVQGGAGNHRTISVEDESNAGDQVMED